MRVLFIINERSGKKRDYDIAEIIRGSSFTPNLVHCSEREQLDALISVAEQDGTEVVFAVGGDGTVHEIAKRLIGRRLALGILPTGSGNGFARHVGLPLEPPKSLEACRGGRLVTIDTATVNDQPFLGVMGLGFDAVIAERFASSQVRGLETYVKEGVRAFASFRAEEYEIAAEAKSVMKRRAFVIAVANSSQYGNNARVAPLASLQDGLLDVVIISEPSLLSMPLMMLRLFSGSFHRSARVQTLQTASLTIRRRAAGIAHLDGEPVQLPAELNVRIVPQSLRLLVPDGAEGF